MSRAKGFSLIELLIVISIISIMSSLALFHWKENKLPKAARMIYSDLQYARMKAIKEKNNYRIIFNNTDGHTYKIHDDQNNDSIIDSIESVIVKDIYSNFKNISINTNANPTFNPVGSSNSGTISLSDGSHLKKVIFSWTGRIRIQ